MIFKKLSTVRKGVSERGIFGFFKYFFFETDNVYVGRFVELIGGKIRIENLVIDTNSRVIPTKNKSQFIQNRFEAPERKSIKQFLDPSSPVIELGGSLGVVACMTNRLLDDPTQHIVIEAHPEMARLLKINKARNDCKFTIVEKAIAYDQATIGFQEEGFSSRVDQSSPNSVNVPTTPLAVIVQEAGFEHFTLICDIEGAENNLLEREPELLRASVTLIVIELHPIIVGEEKFKWSLEQFKRLGFEQIHQESTVYVFRNNAR